VFFLFSLIAKSQSTMEFQTGTSIEVTTDADICADNIIINGTYSGTGTQCGGILPVELVAFTIQSVRDAVTLVWTTATELNNFGFEIERKKIDYGELKITNWETIGFVEGGGTSNTSKDYLFTEQKLLSGKYSYRLKQIDRNGKFTYSQSVDVVISDMPKFFALQQNYPNPFNPSTVIRYQLPVNSKVSLKIYDLLGREIATLVNEEQSAGWKEVDWNATTVASGIYFYKIQSGSFIETKKMLLVK
jgi:hypothetical protein